jgi:hypothetical protein
MSRLKTMVKEKRPMSEICEELPGMFVRYPGGVINLERVLGGASDRPPAMRDVEVTFLFGPTRVGKTTYPTFTEGIKEEDIYRVPLPNKLGDMPFMEGYTGQKYVAFDDFEGTISYQYMKRLLDRPPMRVHVKNGNAWWHATNIYITTNIPVTRWWYKNGKPLTDEDLEPFYARITRTRTWIESASGNLERVKMRIYSEEEYQLFIQANHPGYNRADDQQIAIQGVPFNVNDYSTFKHFVSYLKPNSFYRPYKIPIKGKKFNPIYPNTYTVKYYKIKEEEEEEEERLETFLRNVDIGVEADALMELAGSQPHEVPEEIVQHIPVIDLDEELRQIEELLRDVDIEEQTADDYTLMQQQILFEKECHRNAQAAILSNPVGTPLRVAVKRQRFLPDSP